MKLSKEEETRLTNEMLDMLADARLIGREGLRTVEIRRNLGGEISMRQIALLLRKSSRVGARLVNYRLRWSLTQDELLARFSDGSQLYRKKAEARERLWGATARSSR